MAQGFCLTREQARQIDRLAMEQYGMPGLILMENAGRACAAEAAAMLREAERSLAVIFCGPGNNGGDGFVVARHLWNWGFPVRAFLIGRTGDALGKGGEAAVNLSIALKMGIPVAEIDGPEGVCRAVERSRGAGLILDALFGTGLDKPVREPCRFLISGINELGVPVLAVDVPSGLDCDSGRALGVAVRARRTLTFVLPKCGFRAPGAAAYTGEVKVAEIGLPRQVIRPNATRLAGGGT